MRSYENICFQDRKRLSTGDTVVNNFKITLNKKNSAQSIKHKLYFKFKGCARDKGEGIEVKLEAIESEYE